MVLVLDKTNHTYSLMTPLFNVLLKNHTGKSAAMAGSPF